MRSTIGQIARFAAIGVASTIAYVVLYSLLRSVEAPPLANALALLATTLANTAANRRFTFGVRGANSLVHDHLAGLAGLGVALLITTSAIALLDQVSARPSRLTEVTVLVTANALATLCRFVLLRALIARSGRPASQAHVSLERTAS
jgi:putative flippase GtrA